MYDHVHVRVVHTERGNMPFTRRHRQSGTDESRFYGIPAAAESWCVSFCCVVVCSGVLLFVVWYCVVLCCVYCAVVCCSVLQCCGVVRVDFRVV